MGIVKTHPMPDIQIYVAQRENSSRKPRILHQNMLLQFKGLPRPEDEEIDYQRPQQEQIPTPEMIESTCSDRSSDNASEDDYGQQWKKQPTRRGRAPSSITITDQRPIRRVQRRRAPPRWTQ